MFKNQIIDPFDGCQGAHLESGSSEAASSAALQGHGSIVIAHALNFKLITDQLAIEAGIHPFFADDSSKIIIFDDNGNGFIIFADADFADFYRR